MVYDIVHKATGVAYKARFSGEIPSKTNAKYYWGTVGIIEQQDGEWSIRIKIVTDVNGDENTRKSHLEGFFRRDIKDTGEVIEYPSWKLTDEAGNDVETVHWWTAVKPETLVDKLFQHIKSQELVETLDFNFVEFINSL